MTELYSHADFEQKQNAIKSLPDMVFTVKKIHTGSMAYESAEFGAARSVLMLSKSVEKVILKNHYRDSLTLAKLQTDGNVQHVVG